MKHFKIFITILTLFFTVFACSEAEDGPFVIEPAGDGTALLTMRIGDIRTRADNNFTADSTEKEIKSLACFVQTYGVGDPDSPDYKPGGFNKYFSTEAVKSEMGMESNLTRQSEGVYDVTIAVHSEGFNEDKGTDMLFIANYQHTDPAIDLTDELKALESWEELQTMVTQKATQSPTAPLLMYARKNLVLVEGKTQISTAEMKRMAVRLDVEYVEDLLPGETKKFNLTSVQLLNPKERSFLFPHKEDEVDEIDVATSFPEVTPDTKTPDLIRKIYLYPASNRNDTQPTRIRIKGTYRDTNLPIDKIIDFVDDTGTSLPLVENTHYSLQISPAGDNEELNWKFTVADWSEGRKVEVASPQEPVVLKNITFTPAQTTRWDAAKRSFNIDGLAEGAEMKFAVEGYSPTTFDVLALYNRNASSVGITDPANLSAIVTQEATVTKVDPATQKTTFTQNYTVAIPSQEGREQVPIEVKLYIRSAANYNNADSVVFTSLPDYNGIAGLKPVKFAGQYWAPVNVGATNLTSGDNLAFMGYVYQWGRNDFRSETQMSYDHTDVERGPVSYAQATGVFINKFIKNPDEPRDWLISEDAYKPTRDLLWSKNVNDSPCPKGWRVPRVDELEKLVHANPLGIADLSEMKYTIQADEAGKELILPLAGYRGNNGESNQRGVTGYYWSSSFSANNNAGYLYLGTHAIIRTDYISPVVGASLRCIQE
ncbi:hypothetical protein D0T51_08180 [Parabacteroides sp. 52]|uniref:FISUMP domain-containing protein n=1 Tax=unclassified Parabacteroides TaxID=2649774 RepID=UPI0013D45136|nr:MULTISPECIES: FISUMP domain-containing protein [unclassified Parabacteroides]MDH6534919.1 uncharacterized protein (TIGR02145 family) [Parabacteroides sp. PM5-20]NDV55702.1 hypothetical protein [Parabacteroides sp. 52]